jgi:hypothetical protein
VGQPLLCVRKKREATPCRKKRGHAVEEEEEATATAGQTVAMAGWHSERATTRPRSDLSVSQGDEEGEL